MTLLSDVIHSLHIECSKSKLRKLHWKTTLVWAFAVLLALLTIIMLQDFTCTLQTSLGLHARNASGEILLFQTWIIFARPRTFNYLESQSLLLWLIIVLRCFQEINSWLKPHGICYTSSFIIFLWCLCPPLTSSASVLTCRSLLSSLFFSLAHPLKPNFSHFLPIWCSHSDEHISAHQRVLLSVWALKMSHTALFSTFFFSLFFLGNPLSFLPPFPCPVVPPPSACNQSLGNWRAAKIQFASALLRLKNQEELFPREGGRMTGRSRKEEEEV